MSRSADRRYYRTRWHGVNEGADEPKQLQRARWEWHRLAQQAAQAGFITLSQRYMAEHTKGELLVTNSYNLRGKH